MEAGILVQQAASSSALAAAVVTERRAEDALAKVRTPKLPATPQSVADEAKAQAKRLVDNIMRSANQQNEFHAFVAEGVRELEKSPAFQAMTKKERREAVIIFKEDCELQWKNARSTPPHPHDHS